MENATTETRQPTSTGVHSSTGSSHTLPSVTPLGTGDGLSDTMKARTMETKDAKRSSRLSVQSSFTTPPLESRGSILSQSSLSNGASTRRSSNGTVSPGQPTGSQSGLDTSQSQQQHSPLRKMSSQNSMNLNAGSKQSSPAHASVKSPPGHQGSSTSLTGGATNSQVLTSARRRPSKFGGIGGTETVDILNQKAELDALRLTYHVIFRRLQKSSEGSNYSALFALACEAASQKLGNLVTESNIIQFQQPASTEVNDSPNVAVPEGSHSSLAIFAGPSSKEGRKKSVAWDSGHEQENSNKLKSENGKGGGAIILKTTFAAGSDFQVQQCVPKNGPPLLSDELNSRTLSDDITTTSRVSSFTRELHSEAINVVSKVLQQLMLAAVQGMEGVIECWMGPTKTPSRISWKASAKYGGNSARVLDITRCSVLFKTPLDLREGLKKILNMVSLPEYKDPPISASTYRVKNNFIARSIHGGYRDIKVNLQLSGQLCEIQLHLEAFWAVRKHEGYKKYQAWLHLHSPSSSSYPPSSPTPRPNFLSSASSTVSSGSFPSSYFSSRSLEKLDATLLEGDEVEKREILTEIMRWKKNPSKKVDPVLHARSLYGLNYVKEARAVLEDALEHPASLPFFSGTIEEEKEDKQREKSKGKGSFSIEQRRSRSYSHGDDTGNERNSSTAARTSPLSPENLLAQANPANIEKAILRMRLLGEYASILHEENSLFDAHANALEAFETSTALLGYAHTETITYLDQLTTILGHLEKYAEAEKLLRAALVAIDEAHGLQRPLQSLIVLRSLAAVVRDQKRYADCELFLRESIHIGDVLLGSANPDRISDRAALAVVLSEQHKSEEAELIFREVVAACEVKYGFNHRETLAYAGDLALVLHEKGQYEAAIAVQKRKIEGMGVVFGSEHSSTLLAVSDLIHFKKSANKLVEAENTCRSLIARHEKQTGPMSSATTRALYLLFTVLLQQKRMDEATSLIIEVERRREIIYGVSHPITLSSQLSIARAHADNDKADLALAAFREGLARSKTYLGEKHVTTLQFMIELALFLLTGKPHGVASSPRNHGGTRGGAKMSTTAASMPKVAEKSSEGESSAGCKGSPRAAPKTAGSAGTSSTRAPAKNDGSLSPRANDKDIKGVKCTAAVETDRSNDIASKQEEGRRLLVQALGLQAELSGRKHPDTLWLINKHRELKIPVPDSFANEPTSPRFNVVHLPHKPERDFTTYPGSAPSDIPSIVASANAKALYKITLTTTRVISRLMSSGFKRHAKTFPTPVSSQDVLASPEASPGTVMAVSKQNGMP